MVFVSVADIIFICDSLVGFLARLQPIFSFAGFVILLVSLVISLRLLLIAMRALALLRTPLRVAILGPVTRDVAILTKGLTWYGCAAESASALVSA